MLSNSITLGTPLESLIDQYKVVLEKDKPFPVFVHQNQFINMSQAYAVQKKWVDHLLKSSTKLGYKAGMTSSPAQKKFNTNSPIFGVLLPKRTYKNFSVVPLRPYHRLFVEAELGFRFKTAITKPVDSLYILKKSISEVVTIAELPDMRFSTNADVKLVDVIMTNSGANTIIEGEPIPISAIDDLEVNIIENGKEISRERSGENMEGQLQALQWLVNTTLEKGWPVNPGDLFLTGAIGPMIPATKGRYVINYGDASSLVFDIQ